MKRLIALALVYVGLAILANWLAAKYNGPSALPVGFGLYAPGGVFAIGFVLVVRDWMNQINTKVSLALIPIASLISYVIGELAGWTALERIALASVAAFCVSELVEWAVFTPIRKRSLVAGVALSGTVGLVIDSLVFLSLAFGSLAYLDGQLVGKAEALLVGVVLTAMRRVWLPTPSAASA